MIRGIETAERHGIITMCQFIIGLPGDTIEDIKETARIRRRVGMSRYGVNIAWVLPGTNIYDEAKKRGMNDEVYLQSGAPFYTFEQPIETLRYWATLI
jgi:radical SAM superfamily enzyme YgiQ (UPF0313 family)